MKIYTKTGDGGETGLVGGKRVPKDSVRIQAVGDVDELNALLGVCRTLNSDPFPEKILSHLQHELFDLGADLSTPVGETVQVPRVTDSQVKQLEQWIDEIDSKIEPLKNFILPGGSASAAQLHLTRSVSRRAERALVTLSKSEELNTFVLQYLNRLSDLLFMLARYANSAAGVAEVKWEGLGSV